MSSLAVPQACLRHSVPFDVLDELGSDRSRICSRDVSGAEQVSFRPQCA